MMPKYKYSQNIAIDDIVYLNSHTNHRNFSNWPTISDEMVGKYLIDETVRECELGNFLICRHNDVPIGFVSIVEQGWDTQFFGFKCYKINKLLAVDYIHPIERINLIQDMILTCMNRFALDAKLILSDIDSWDFEQNQALQICQFRYILAWIDGFYTGSCFSIDFPKGHSASLYEDYDYSAIKKFIGKTYFRGGRFYLDSSFRQSNPRLIYESLFENAIINDIVYVYRIEGRAVGVFISKKPTYIDPLRISISALRFLLVDPEYRRMNVATNLYKSFVNYLLPYSDLITTGLEVHNIPSMNLHANLNFYFNFTHNAYHLWRK